MKLVVEYELDNSDGFYNVPTEIAYEIILEAITKDMPIHGLRNIIITTKD